MLPAEHRLRRSVDFDQAVRRGARASSDTLVVHLAIEPTAARRAEVGFIVSKAVGNAVTRNLVKRRLRAIVATRLGALPQGSLTVLRALPQAAGSDYATLEHDVDVTLAAASRRWTQRHLDSNRGGRP